VRFRAAAELTPQALAAITDQVRIRVLRWFVRTGLIELDDIREMLAGKNSRLSLDASQSASPLGMARGWSACCSSILGHPTSGRP
jgi:hypothetical protein